MVKGGLTKEEKDALRRVKALEKSTRKNAKRAARLKKRETFDYRKQKQQGIRSAYRAKKREKIEIRANINATKKEIMDNASAIYGSEKRSLNRMLKKKNISKRLVLGIFMNLVFSIFEFIGGAISGSAAIMSDAIHDLGDALSLSFSAYFEKKSKHGPDKKYTYGYSRFSILGVFVTTVILVVGAAFMIYISVLRLINPTTIDIQLMLILSVIGLVINTFAAFRTPNGRFNVLKSISKNSVNDIILEDVIGWTVVLIGTTVMAVSGWTFIDPIMSILISFYLIMSSFNSFKKVLELFLEKVPEGTSVDVVKFQVLAIPHVKGVHNIHLWSMDGEKLCATMHVVADGKIVDGILIENSISNPTNLKKEIRKQLKTTGISEVTIEIETEGESCK